MWSNRLASFFFLVLMLVPSATGVCNDDETITLPSIFSDRMVFQRDYPLSVWGWGKPGETYIVGLAGIKAEAKTDTSGQWVTTLPPFPAGGPHQLVISGPGQRKVFHDVMVGDVWLCAGQSNMAFTVANANKAAEVIANSENRNLRQFLIAHKASPVAIKDCDGSWTTASPDTVDSWTAVGYFFARDLQNQLHIPIGIINASWNETRVEAWISRDALFPLSGTLSDLVQLDWQVAYYAAHKNRLNEERRLWNAAKNHLINAESDVKHQNEFASPRRDDSVWSWMQTPSFWDARGFRNVKGEAWYRKTVEIPAAWADKDLILSPGAASEIESSFFNGVQVGQTGSVDPFNSTGWNKQRKYTIPGKLVKAGKAIIAVRVVNLFGRGGLHSNGDPKAMWLRRADTTEGAIPLAGSWRFTFAFQLPPEPMLAVKPNTASVLFNGMIHPLLLFPIKGVLWYQGEANTDNAYEYRVRFQTLIQDWRTQWGRDFSFLWVQLANYDKPQGNPVSDNWAVLRESQDKALQLPRTGTALAIDLGEQDTMYPRDKQTVGERLALVARNVTYGEKKLVYSGPRYKAIKVEGDKIRVFFDHIGSGLMVKKDGELNRFSIAGKDRQFVWAKAKIDGNTVLVWSEEVPEPLAVRYAFETNPAGCNLFNKEGLPAAPFRSDHWLVATQPPQPDEN